MSWSLSIRIKQGPKSTPSPTPVWILLPGNGFGAETYRSRFSRLPRWGCSWLLFPELELHPAAGPEPHEEDAHPPGTRSARRGWCHQWWVLRLCMCLCVKQKWSWQSADCDSFFHQAWGKTVILWCMLMSPELLQVTLSSNDCNPLGAI